MATDPELIFALIGAFVGVGTGGYGAIQSWITQRKTRQISLEMLMTKIDMSFSYNIFELDDHKVLHGIITFKNLGTTNLRIPEFQIDGEDRSKQFAKAYQGEDFSAVNNFEIQRFSGVNNSHLVKFGMTGSRSFFIKYTDNIYSKREGRVRILDMKSNISRYISEKIEKMKESDRESLQEYFFKTTLGKEIRGFQLFPGAEKTQEFMLEYEGTGVCYLNVETTTVRMLQSSIDEYERLKSLGDEIVQLGRLDLEHEEKFRNLTQSSLTPASKELERQKETFLVYLK